jgi:hypothetical protein
VAFQPVHEIVEQSIWQIKATLSDGGMHTVFIELK